MTSNAEIDIQNTPKNGNLLNQGQGSTIFQTQASFGSQSQVLPTQSFTNQTSGLHEPFIKQAVTDNVIKSAVKN